MWFSNVATTGLGKADRCFRTFAFSAPVGASIQVRLRSRHRRRADGFESRSGRWKGSLHELRRIEIEAKKSFRTPENFSRIFVSTGSADPVSLHSRCKRSADRSRSARGVSSAAAANGAVAVVRLTKKVCLLNRTLAGSSEGFQVSMPQPEVNCPSSGV